LNTYPIRSPFFYVGDKYKLVPQLKKLLPHRITMYIEPFVGGGSSLLNVEADTYWANDIDKNVIKLHRFFSSFAHSPEDLFDALFENIKKYNLSCSYCGYYVPDCLKKEYPKTYYSHFNKPGYLQMRDDFNADQSNCILLYLLLIYGFNHMIRYNASGFFNLPAGNVDFNQNVYNALNGYLSFMRTHTVNWFDGDYWSFCRQIPMDTDAAYVFCDPPYLISNSEYNKLWNAEKEAQFYLFLDHLNANKIKFGVTNLAFHKGQENFIFTNWASKYFAYRLKSNYISFNDNSIKNDSTEFFITNVHCANSENISNFCCQQKSGFNSYVQEELFDYDEFFMESKIVGEK